MCIEQSDENPFETNRYRCYQWFSGPQFLADPLKDQNVRIDAGSAPDLNINARS